MKSRRSLLNSRTPRTAALVAGACALVAAIWYVHFALKPYEVSDAEFRAAYELRGDGIPNLRMQPLDERSARFTYRSFDGAEVNGRIHYPSPSADAAPVPVMIGAHGMGRSELRWWLDSFKGRPTIEQTHLLSRLALERGYAVVAIDARQHGQRKDPRKSLKRIMRGLHLLGERHDYEAMVRDTVRDHRVLLNWIASDPAFDGSRIGVAGYSMGAQVALLLAGVDPRVTGVLAIVPPHIDDRTAIVAPRNGLSGLRGKRVWMLSANDDEHASSQQNRALFDALPATDKRHLTYDGSHILPEGYTGDLADWF